MNVYTAQHLSKAHHTQHLAKADQARLVKQAHLATRGTTVSAARRPISWLREAAGHFATRLMARSAHAGSH